MKLGLYCQIGQSLDMAKFAIHHAIQNSGLTFRKDFDIVFICWKTSPQVFEWLDANQYRLVDIGYEEGKGFLWNLYRGWNAGYKYWFNRYSEIDYVVPIATDHYFHTNWLINMLRWAKHNRIVNCKLIEPGTLPSLHTTRNFGLTTWKDFQLNECINFCDKISKNKLVVNEANYGHRLDAMPFLVPRDVWRRFGPMNKTLDAAGITGDTNFFNRCKDGGVEITKSLDAISYHCGGIETKRNAKQGVYT